MNQLPEAGPIQGARWRPWVRYTMAAVVILLLAAVVVWNLVPPLRFDHPVQLVRGANGQFTPVGDSSDTSQRPRLEIHAGKIEAQSNLLTSSAIAGNPRARLACRSVLLTCRDDHLLTERVARDLVEALQGIPYVAEIRYLPLGEQLPEGSRLPDLFINMELLSLEEHGIVDHQVDAKFRVQWGTSPVDDHYTEVDQLTPPVLEFASDAELAHHSSTREVASSAAKYKLVAADIAKRIADPIAKQLDEFAHKYGLLPELPASFYLDYHAPPELPLADFQAARVLTGSGLLKHNETVWVCRSNLTLKEAIPKLRARLEAIGYENTEVHPSAQMLRMRRDNAIVMLFGERARTNLISSGVADQPPTLMVTYLERVSSAELESLMDGVLESNVSLDTLLLLEKFLSHRHLQTVLSRLAEQPPRTAEACEVAASLYLRNGERERALAAIETAVSLLAFEADPSRLRNNLNQIAEKLGEKNLVESLIKNPPDPQLNRVEGIVEIVDDQDHDPVEFNLGDAAIFRVRGPAGDWELFQYSVRPAGQKNQSEYELSIARVGPHGRSISRQTLHSYSPAVHAVTVDGLGILHFEASQIAEQPRFRVTAELRPE